MTEPDQILFTGRIHTDELDRAAKVIATWAGAQAPEGPIDEYWLAQDQLEVLLQDISDSDDSLLLVEGKLVLDYEGARARLARLATSLKQEGLTGSIDFVPVDADDNELGEALTVQV